MLRITHRIKALGAVLTAAATVLLAAAGPAAAAESPDPASTCGAAANGKPFSTWGDNANYVLLPDGGFEHGGMGWTLTGANVVDGNETFSVRACGDAKSLSLPAGAVATSPERQIDLSYPTLRLFARNTAAEGRLAVHVLFRTPDKVARQLKIADLSADAAWQPTRVVFLLANLLALYPGWDGQVQFRFTANGGDWQIDDVFIDPYER